MMTGNAMVDYGRGWREDEDEDAACDCGRNSCVDCTPECPACDEPRARCICVAVGSALRIAIAMRRDYQAAMDRGAL